MSLATLLYTVKRRRSAGWRVSRLDVEFQTRKELPGGFYRHCDDHDIDGKPYDRLEAGFFVWDEKRVVDGPQYTLANNVYSVNGRPTYMPGADTHGGFLETWQTVHSPGTRMP